MINQTNITIIFEVKKQFAQCFNELNSSATNINIGEQFIYFNLTSSNNCVNCLLLQMTVFKFPFEIQ